LAHFVFVDVVILLERTAAALAPGIKLRVGGSGRDSTWLTICQSTAQHSHAEQPHPSVIVHAECNT